MRMKIKETKNLRDNLKKVKDKDLRIENLEQRIKLLEDFLGVV